MKKIIAIVCLLISGTGIGLYQYFYGGSSYYTQISDSGTEIIHTVDGTNEKVVDYQYQQTAYNEKGEKRQVDFNGSIGRPLKQGAFLQLKVNRINGVLSWEEITETEVPEKALADLTH